MAQLEREEAEFAKLKAEINAALAEIERYTSHEQAPPCVQYAAARLQAAGQSVSKPNGSRSPKLVEEECP